MYIIYSVFIKIPEYERCQVIQLKLFNGGIELQFSMPCFIGPEILPDDIIYGNYTDYKKILFYPMSEKYVMVFVKNQDENYYTLLDLYRYKTLFKVTLIHQDLLNYEPPIVISDKEKINDILQTYISSSNFFEYVFFSFLLQYTN